MKIGTKYKLNPAHVKKFIDMSPSNYHMVDLIEKHGGWFIPLEKTTSDDDKFVSKVKMADGQIFDDECESYFELCEKEFCLFDEITDVVPGVNSINVTITPDNAKDIIKLINSTFGY